MTPEYLKRTKENNDQILAQLRDDTNICPICILPSKADLARTQRRIVREFSDSHWPIFNARKNK